MFLLRVLFESALSAEVFWLSCFSAFRDFLFVPLKPLLSEPVYPKVASRAALLRPKSLKGDHTFWHCNLTWLRECAPGL